MSLFVTNYSKRARQITTILCLVYSFCAQTILSARESATDTAAPTWFSDQTSLPQIDKNPALTIAPSAVTMASSFNLFKPHVSYYWDNSSFYLESDGRPMSSIMPTLMVGITSWQQQIPLVTSYFNYTTNPESDKASIGYGQPNVWKLPLSPTPSSSPIPISAGNFQRGAIAIAADGVAIFNPRNNTGRVSYEIGELDLYGGHCGLADDYHYHIAPVHLQKILGIDKPIAWMLDGYPLYGYTEPDGSAQLPLDANGGHSHGNWGYHYHAIGSAQTGPKPPYLPSAFYGNVINYGGQVDGQPEVSSIRKSGTGGYNANPVSGASIVGYMNPVALTADTAGNLSLDPSGTPSADNYLMRVAVGNSTYDICWVLNRTPNPKSLTITWRLPTVPATTTTYSSVNNRITTFPVAAPSLLKLPDTGQTIRQGTTFGQDADYSINTPSYKDNLDGTITDNVTGLMWQKVDAGECTWANAQSNASSIRTGGYSDWRLPTPTELFSIMNHNIGNPAAINTTYFPSNPSGAADYWWTSIIYGSDATHIWCVNSGGGVGPKPLTETLSAGGTFRYHARYVRGASPSIGHNYSNNLDGTITDLDTGLMWTQVPGPAMTWQAALSYATSLKTGGYSDWRLPNIKELQTLADYNLTVATTQTSALAPVNRIMFPAATTPATAYWSSTVQIQGSSPYTRAWLQEFGVNNSVPAANGPTRNMQGIISYEVMTASYPVFAVRTSSSGSAPQITSQPTSQNVATSSSVVFRIVATSSTPLSYQWNFNGTAISGATNQNLYLSNLTSSSAGNYSCTISNSSGSVTSTSALLSVVDSANPGRLINISTLASIQKNGSLTSGFVVGGAGTSGSQQVLIRSSGPALTSFGVSNPLPDPSLQLNLLSNVNTVVGSNTGWGGLSAISQAATSVGAFTWTSNTSKDSALIFSGNSSLNKASYSAVVSSSSSNTGTTLLEIYDATTTYTTTTPRLINLSSLSSVQAGGNALTAGFVIGGSTSKTVLIRAAGPSLAQYGISSYIPDPQITLFSGSNTLASNAGWAADSQISTVAATVGAFSWGKTSTADSAILITLAPGSYTAQVNGVSGDTGATLIEVYDVP